MCILINHHYYHYRYVQDMLCHQFKMVPIVDVKSTQRVMEIGIQRKSRRRSKSCCTFLMHCLIPNFCAFSIVYECQG